MIKCIGVLSVVCLMMVNTIQAQEKMGRLIWQDEFNTEGFPNPKKWDFDHGGKGVVWNYEKQYYTKNRLKNARVEKGNLIIEAHKEKYEGSHYTSARLHTKNKLKLQYGIIEVRAKLPKGLGTWPAIWMLSDDRNTGKYDNDGEIDIMEHVGYDQGKVHASVHTTNYNGRKTFQATDTLVVNDVSEEYHVYKVDWSPKKIEFYIDNKKYLTYENPTYGKETWPFDRPYHLLLNIAVGGTWGGLKGIDDSIFPQRMYIDYVRIYKKEEHQ